MPCPLLRPFGILVLGILGVGLPVSGFADVVDLPPNSIALTSATHPVHLSPVAAPESPPGAYEVQAVDLVFDPPNPNLCGPGPVSLIGSFSIPFTLTDVVEMIAVIDLQTNSPSLPPFWQFGKDECNDGNLILNVGGTPWTCGRLQYTSSFGGVPNRARIILAGYPTTPVTFDAGVVYKDFTLDFILPDAGACAGCDEPTAVVLNQINLTQGICHGNCEFCNLVSVDDAIPGDARLQNVPNPFHASTTIQFTLPRAGEVKLDVFDLSGRIVRQLYRGSLPTGAHSVTWDGLDQTGHRAPEGVYFYRLTAGSSSETRWTVLMR
jgi:hypothetical protein